MFLSCSKFRHLAKLQKEVERGVKICTFDVGLGGKDGYTASCQKGRRQ